MCDLTSSTMLQSFESFSGHLPLGYQVSELLTSTIYELTSNASKYSMSSSLIHYMKIKCPEAKPLWKCYCFNDNFLSFLLLSLSIFHLLPKLLFHAATCLSLQIVHTMNSCWHVKWWREDAIQGKWDWKIWKWGTLGRFS